jgi:iron complex outermembrane receptor protein
MLKITHFRFTLLSFTLLSVSLVGNVSSAWASDDVKAETTEIEQILITGSRIKRFDLELASAVQVISADEIKKKGFNTIYETLQSTSIASGSNQSGRSARNIETINLRGFGPNRTLFLLNGKRVANYPRVYNGNDNAFNLASIPIAAVERIEIVTGASSSIYGSDAVGGVVNIITKNNIDATTLSISGSTSDQGDANNKRLSLVTGNTKNDSNWTLAVEHENQDMLTGKQRDWLNDRFDTPADIEGQSEFRTQLPRSLAVFQLQDDWVFLEPGESVCQQYNGLTYTSISFLGHYCGRDTTGDNSFIGARENLSIYFSGSYDLTQQQELTIDVLHWQSKATHLNSQGWSSDHLKNEIQDTSNWSGDGQFIVEDGTHYMITRDFQREEMLNGKGLEEVFDESMLNISVAVRGNVLSEYDYEVYLSHSLAKNTQSSYQLKKESASDYYVSHDVTTDALSVDFDKWWQPLSESGFHTIFGFDQSSSDARVTTAGASLTGELIQLFNRSIEFATFVEFESSRYDLNEHPRTLNKVGQGWVGKVGTEGSGKRNRYALGGEVKIPLADNLTAEVAARYDRYLDNTLASVAPTYKLGLMWQLTEQLMLRATRGTIFRAPDLHNVFKDVSGSYDYMSDLVLIDSCNAFHEGRPEDILIGGENLESLSKTCDEQFDFTGYYSALNQSSGNKKLRAETGYTNTIGAVLMPSSGTSFSFDFYNIKLKNIITPDSVHMLNINEWQCFTQQRSLSDPTCVSTLSNIDRNAEEGYDSFKINTIRSSYINSAMRETSGFDVGVNLLFEMGNDVQLNFDSTYNHVLDTKVQTFSDEAVDKNYRDNYYNSDVRSKINSSLGLQTDNWNLSLSHIRYGSLPNDVDPGDWTQLGKKRYAPLDLYNLAVDYQIVEQQNIRLGVMNLFDAKAHSDASEQHYPYFDTSAYPTNSIVIGRQFSLSYQVIL